VITLNLTWEMYGLMDGCVDEHIDRRDNLATTNQEDLHCVQPFLCSKRVTMLGSSHLTPLWGNVLTLVDFASWLTALSCKWQCAFCWGAFRHLVCVYIFLLLV
jgi:hypothetical protein